MSYEGRFDYGCLEVGMVESGGRCGVAEEGEMWRKRNRRSHRHVAHREKAPMAVARRNARERRRVEAVNGAFLRLRKAVPVDALSDGSTTERSKRVSKVKTLHRAIEYISRLQSILQDSGCTIDPYERRGRFHRVSVLFQFFRERCCEERSSGYDESSEDVVWHGEENNGYHEARMDCDFNVIQTYDGGN
ncbi:hypothetical protein J437_LFUL019244 [Ladona fulva]|uniref:BHLH domain-containing protein n=1 Tax=Ladona fulva TaxID=123851 RepID=A0A8K0KTP2_LADFU|nr:hypothetical protein J437_LFUL019244 [Ladona fulva]